MNVPTHVIPNELSYEKSENAILKTIKSPRTRRTPDVGDGKHAFYYICFMFIHFFYFSYLNDKCRDFFYSTKFN